jgi:hypothetical protein
MERLEEMKEALICCVESQVYGNLKEVDTKELGEAIDMIKDLSEAIYYCTITEAMGESEEREPAPHGTMYSMPYPMYNKGVSRPAMRTGGTPRDMGGNTRNYREGMIPYRMEDYEMIQDPQTGKSAWRRKMYMEGKQLHRDKSKQMQELDIYMQELAEDMSEMISDASPEEKQLLQ